MGMGQFKRGDSTSFLHQMIQITKILLTSVFLFLFNGLSPPISILWQVNVPFIAKCLVFIFGNDNPDIIVNKNC